MGRNLFLPVAVATYLLLVCLVAYFNRLGDFEIAYYVATAIVAFLCVWILRLNVWKAFCAALAIGVLSVAGISVATYLNGYNDPPPFSLLGLTGLGAYLIGPSILIWIGVSVAIGASGRRHERV